MKRGKPAAEDHDIHGPYWLRAHQDWRFWAAVTMMLVAIGTYVSTIDLAWWP